MKGSHSRSMPLRPVIGREHAGGALACLLTGFPIIVKAENAVPPADQWSPAAGIRFYR